MFSIAYYRDVLCSQYSFSTRIDNYYYETIYSNIAALLSRPFSSFFFFFSFSEMEFLKECEKRLFFSPVG